MSRDTTDLLKVLAVTFLVFAGTALVMLYVHVLLATYGANLPVIDALRLNSMPLMPSILGSTGLFVMLASVHISASGLALLLTSNTIDMALIIMAKAGAVLIAAMLGIAGGHMIYLQLAEGNARNFDPLQPTLITLVALLLYLLFSTVLSVPVLRRLGPLRFVLGVGLFILGVLLLAWFY